MNFPPKSEVYKIQSEKPELKIDKQQRTFNKLGLNSKAVTIVSLRISHVLAKNKK